MWAQVKSLGSMRAADAWPPPLLLCTHTDTWLADTPACARAPHARTPPLPRLLPLAPRSTLCRYYLQGACAFGDKCRFSHNRSDEPSQVRQTARPGRGVRWCGVAASGPGLVWCGLVWSSPGPQLVLGCVVWCGVV